MVTGIGPVGPPDGSPSGMEGPAINAYLGQINAFNFDKFSNLYVYSTLRSPTQDSHYGSFFRINETNGIVTRIPVDFGIENVFCPSMTLDGANRIYLNCQGALVRFDPLTGVMQNLSLAASTVSSPDGTPLAETSFASLGNVWMDIQGNLFVMDGTTIKVIRGVGTPTIPDTTPPIITPVTTGARSGSGWFSTDAHLAWEVVDADSAIVTREGCDAVDVVDDTAGRTFTCTASSGGGTASASYTIRRDTGAPLAFATRAPFANADGWNNTPVRVKISGLDALSGIASCSPDELLGTEGAGQSSTPGTCLDPADNRSAEVRISDINIDLTPPSLLAKVVTPPGANGWYNQIPVITFTASDLLSGVSIDGCSEPKTLLTDGQGLAVQGACRDRAGNVANGGLQDLKIDRTPPVAYATVSPPANAAGWHSESVVVDYSGTDALGGSGLASCTPSRVVSAEGGGQSFPGQCTDIAGNPSALVPVRVNIDRVAPAIVVQAPVDGAAYRVGAAVNASYYCTDSTSGVVACAGTVANGAALPTSTVGTQPFSVVAVDAAGLETRVSGTYTVTDTAAGQLASSSVLSFGNQAVGVASPAQTITLVNNGTADLSISGVAASGANANDYQVGGNCTGALIPGASCEISVVLTPSTEGSSSASLVISLGSPVVAAKTGPALFSKSGPLVLAQATSSPAGTPSGSNVGLVGYGVVPRLRLEGSPADFGLQRVGQVSASASVKVVNAGTVAVNLTQVLVDGANASDFARTNTCPARMAAGESCTVGVVFQASAVGRRQARLTVKAAGLAPLSAALQGMGANSLNPPADGLGSASTPAASALDLMAVLPALNSGFYWFDPDGAGAAVPFITFADLETSGGGWMQVRRVAANNGWFPVDDDLAGTEPLNATQATTYNAGQHWSLPYAGFVNANTEFLFTSGDYSKWCVLQRGTQRFDGTLDPNAETALVLDSFGTARGSGERTNVMLRNLGQDPTIGCEGTEAANFAYALYAEAPATATEDFKAAHGGMNVFIRQGSAAGLRPKVRATVTGTLSGSGWYTSDVAVSWNIEGFGATVTQTTGCDPVTVTTDVISSVLRCSATTAGGVGSASVSINRDTTAPTVVPRPMALPNAAGWHHGPVTVRFDGTDSGSGIANCSADARVVTEGAGQTSSTGTCTDAAGNEAAPVALTNVNIDQGLPTVFATAVPAANAAGWNNTAVEVQFSANDALSGVAADGCDAPQVIASTGIGLAATGTCRDRAGNQAAATLAGIKIDRTAPVAYVSTAPAANAANWNRTPVTVTFSGTDSLSGSGLAGCSAAVVVNTDGLAQTRAGNCTDLAGNNSNTASATVNLDTTAPVIEIAAPTNSSYLQNSVNNATYTCTDTLAGIIGCLGTVPSGNAFSTTTLGANSFTVQATDLAGNSTMRTVSYTVVAPSPFTVSPTALAFGNQALNTSAAQVVTVRNNTAAALTLTAPTLSGTNANQFTLARTCGTSLAANASCTITVTFKPTGAGAKTAAFSIRIGTTTQSVALSGNGVAATYTLSATALTFPSTTRNTSSASQRITVANTSSVAMPLTTIALGGTNANQFVKTQTCGTSLAANSSCFVDVAFKPTSAGSKSATLTVTPGGGATAKSVTLKGTGL